MKFVEVKTLHKTPDYSTKGTHCLDIGHRRVIL